MTAIKQPAKPTTKRKASPRARRVKIGTPWLVMLFKLIATIAAGFLPIASYWIMHYEIMPNASSIDLLIVIKILLVLAALVYSAPTLAAWANNWTSNKYKSWGFTILLEGVMIGSDTQWLALCALGILTLVNAAIAFDKNQTN